MTQQDALNAFYSDLAEEYDELLYDAGLEDELDVLEEAVAELFEGHTVLELACGTGHWTETLAYVAQSVTATDINADMLAVARERGLEAEAPVQFEVMDARAIPEAPGRYTACFAGFYWSHIPREAQDKTLKMLRKHLGKDTLLVLIDDVFVEGETMPIAKTDLEGNTSLIIPGPSGDRHEILKNFPTDSYLKKRFADHAREIRVKRTEHYWILSCRLK
jgi:SAM-dependent methyltransferase